MTEFKKKIAVTQVLGNGSDIEDENGLTVMVRKVATRSLLPIDNHTDTDLFWIADEDTLVNWDVPTNDWKGIKVDSSAIVNGWLKAVDTFDDLSTTYTNPQNGDTVVVLDELTIYTWNSTLSIWKPPAAYAKGFTNGCRLVYNSTTLIDVDAGTIEIKGNTVSKTTHTQLGWTDLDVGTTKKASTWYFVYVEIDPLDRGTFIGFISEQTPTKDALGNTQNPDDNASKYHPTRNARFVGSFKTNASQNIVKFKVTGNYVTYIGQGYNYFLSGGNARTKTGVNCRAFVPLTSSLASVYYEFGAGTNIRNVGDVDAWYINGPAGVGTLILPITNNNVYYVCSGNNVVSLGIHGYYEDI